MAAVTFLLKNKTKSNLKSKRFCINTIKHGHITCKYFKITTVSLQRRSARYDFNELPGDDGLPGPVEQQCKLANHLGGILGGVVHGSHSGGLFGGRALLQRVVQQRRQGPLRVALQSIVVNIVERSHVWCVLWNQFVSFILVLTFMQVQ